MKHWKKIIPGLSLAVIALLGRSLVRANHDNILVYSGAGTYRILLSASGIALLLGGGLLGYGIISAVLKQRSEHAAAAARQKEAQKPAPLSAAEGRFEESEIRSRLLSLFSGVPPKVMSYLEAYQAQLDRMNAYQARLSQLLEQNGAQDLGEAESFLDRVEQNMFGTLRRVFNLLMMYDETQPIQPLLDQLADAQAHNDRALDQASRLCAAMTDYVNNQGATADVYGSVEQFIQILQEELV